MSGSFRRLDTEKVVDTMDRLSRRIAERFPDRGLYRVSEEILAVAREAKQRCKVIGRPHLGLRLLGGTLALGMLGLLGYELVTLDYQPLSEREMSVKDFVELLEPTLGSIVFFGAALLFLFSLENRFKRARALESLHELRSLAHVIDMHQLTKDPERLRGRGPDTASSPKQDMTPFLLSRYFDYCAEMLAVLSKIAALYVQDYDDPVALETVDQIENLTTGLSRKIWQKMMVLEVDDDDASESSAPIRA